MKPLRLHPLLFIALLVAASLPFHDAISAIFTSWRQDEYSHGYFIPVIALVLLFNKIDDARIVPRNSWLGFAVMTLCILLHIVFHAAGLEALLPDLYLVFLIGGMMTFWGAQSTWRLAGPLGFLMFCAPLPVFFYYTLSFHMQMLSTSLGTAMLETLGVPVFQDGNIIDLGGYKLQVAEACSGLRYAFPLLSLSYLFAYMYRASMAKRLVLFLSALPIAVAMNSLRIAVIGVTVDAWGPGMAEGLIHEFEGWMVFLGCIACLLVEIKLMQCVGRRGTLDFDCLRIPHLSRMKLPPIGAPAIAAGLTVMAALLGMPFMSSAPPRDVPLRQSFTFFPLQIGPWIGHFASLDALSLSKLGTKDYVLADYARPDAPPVNLYALYYGRQDSASNEAVHTPTVCIPAGGWTIAASAVKTLLLRDGASLAVNKVIIAKGTVRQVVYYWYMQDGHSTTGVGATRLYTLLNALTRNRTNGALLRLITGIASDETESAAEQRLIDFLDAGLDTLKDYMFPGEGK